MRTVKVAGGIALAVVAIVGAWILFVGLPRWYAPKPVSAPPPAAPAAESPASVRKITATLFYVSDNGLSLVGATKEVPFGASVGEQARAILEAQFASAPPAVNAVPAGTTLHNVFVTDKGEAFVDVSSELTTRHTGGFLDEILTAYTIVNAVTVNLPAITRVQILIDGHEVDTLAGHLDLRHPLARNLDWVQHDTH